MWSGNRLKITVVSDRQDVRVTKTSQQMRHSLGLPSLEYRRERADMIQVYKILNDIDKVNKDKLFTMSHNIGTRGHQFKIYNNRYRLNVRGTE